MKRVLLVVLVTMVAMSASATKIRRLTLEQVRDRAESIFVGRVVSWSESATLNGGLRVTTYTIAVTEVLYGTVSQTTTVSYLGSRDDAIEGAPLPQPGTTYVFFKTGQPSNTTVGWGQGLYAVESAKSADGRSRGVVISGDGELLVLRDGRLARGRQVSVRNGALVQAGVDGSGTGIQRVTDMKMFNADGTPAPHVKHQASVAQPAETYATLDDLRTFVRAKRGVSAE